MTLKTATKTRRDKDITSKRQRHEEISFQLNINRNKLKENWKKELKGIILEPESKTFNHQNRSIVKCSSIRQYKVAGMCT